MIEQKTLESITLVANASDTDGIIESVLFEVNDNKLSEGNNKSWTPVNYGDYKIKVTVADNKGATASHQINITIKLVDGQIYVAIKWILCYEMS